MKKVIFLFTVLLLLTCCTLLVKKITVDQVFKSGRSFLNSKFEKMKILDNKSFVMFTTPDSTSYVFKKADIVIGDLNNDGAQDAIITYIVVLKDKTFFNKQVIFINNKGILIPQKEFKLEVFIRKIEDGVVLAEKSKIAADSPNFGCHSCMVKVKLRFEKDSLIQISK
ncbi:MAG: hypothetical protein HXX14_18915 [Bacteroidetes bacterium]|nr:hypothetical protein [Bacteroidota bacterium]